MGFFIPIYKLFVFLIMEELNKSRFSVLGVNVHALQVNQALEIIKNWQESNDSFRYISSTNLNNIMVAQKSPEYYDVMQHAALSLPDGMPLIWHGKRLGFKLDKRCGIEEVMVELFELSNQGHNYSHYFYGNTPAVLRKMKSKLLEAYPNLNIAGMHSPPFRQLSEEEEDEHIKQINDAKPDFLWVSLGCPKQETWLYKNRHKLNPMIGGGAGAVFNFLSGETVKAPKWVQYAGLEWLMRLCLNPKRLYRRYLILYPDCVYRWITDTQAPHIKQAAASNNGTRF